MSYIKIVLVILFFIIFFGISLVLYFNGSDVLIKSSFAGKVERITYDEKKIANVTINNVEFHLTPLRKEFEENVEVGDSLVKIQNQSSYKLIKQKTGEEMQFEF